MDGTWYLPDASCKEVRGWRARPDRYNLPSGNTEGGEEKKKKKKKKLGTQSWMPPARKSRGVGAPGLIRYGLPSGGGEERKKKKKKTLMERIDVCSAVSFQSHFVQVEELLREIGD